MINAAAVRAQVAQIEKYKSAVNTFKSKYNNQLPGDIDNADAVAFGFQARGTIPGEGDGNGILEGYVNGGAITHNGAGQGTGETLMFWVDLSQANLIDATLNTASSTALLGQTINATSTPPLSAFYPPAKIGNGNYVYVYSGGPGNGNGAAPTNMDGNNYFGITNITNITSNMYLTATAGLTVQQAYNIDTKVDDGIPTTGNVTAVVLFHLFAEWVSIINGSPSTLSPPTQTPAAAADCFDNGNVSGAPEHYSTEYNFGSNVNCSLSFRF